MKIHSNGLQNLRFTKNQCNTCTAMYKKISDETGKFQKQTNKMKKDN